MTTLFDVGDKIKLTLEGEVIEYSTSKNGDCYIIEIKSPRGDGKSRVYFETNDLIAGGARKVTDDVSSVMDSDTIKKLVNSSQDYIFAYCKDCPNFGKGPCWCTLGGLQCAYAVVN